MPEAFRDAGADFAAFYERHFRAVYRICLTYMKNTADAEDCTEDVFVKVLGGDFRFHDEGHERAWLTVTAMNLCKDRLKHWWRRVGSIDDADEAADDGIRTDEIAAMLKKPPSTIRNHLREARELLKKQLGGSI